MSVVFVNDTFTGTDGVDINSRAGEVGATWTSGPSSAAGALIKTNRVHGGGTARRYYASGVPASADYDVEAVVYCVSDAASGTGPMGRVNTSLVTYYCAPWNATNNNLTLSKRVSPGAEQVLGTYADSPAAGQQRTVVLRMRGDQLSVYVDGVLRIGPITDTAITAAGRVGAQIASSNTATGIHLDSITGRGYWPRAKAAGVYAAKPALVKAGGVFVGKPMTTKVGGVFV